MDLKFIILIVFVGVIGITAVSASWFGYDTGECDLFYINAPESYHNAGELTYNESLFITTPSHERPYHSIHVYQIGISFMGAFTDFEEERITVEDSVDEGNFKAFKTTKGLFDNTTYVFYSNGQYDYQLELSHRGCPYDDAQFKKDVTLLKSVAYSIKRK